MKISGGKKLARDRRAGADVQMAGQLDRWCCWKPAAYRTRRRWSRI